MKLGQVALVAGSLRREEKQRTTLVVEHEMCDRTTARSTRDVRRDGNGSWVASVDPTRLLECA